MGKIELKATEKKEVVVKKVKKLDLGKCPACSKSIEAYDDRGGLNFIVSNGKRFCNEECLAKGVK